MHKFPLITFFLLHFLGADADDLTACQKHQKGRQLRHERRRLGRLQEDQQGQKDAGHLNIHRIANTPKRKFAEVGQLAETKIRQSDCAMLG